MKGLILAAIRRSLLFLVTATLFSIQPAQAYKVTLREIGDNVVAHGSGAINLTGLTLAGGGFSSAGMNPSIAVLAVATGTQGSISGLFRTIKFWAGRFYLRQQ